VGNKIGRNTKVIEKLETKNQGGTKTIVPELLKDKLS